MGRPHQPRSPLRRLAADTRGAAMVEFAITLPLLLLIFAVTIEGSRMFWSYQTAITGVRDATRYLARVAPADICPSGSLAGYTTKLTEIVRDRANGDPLLPALVTVNSVTPSLTCEAGPAIPYRNDPAPIATVTAQVTIQPRFFAVLAPAPADLTFTVTDSSRIYGS